MRPVATSIGAAVTAVLAVAVTTATAAANTHRFAVIAGNNQGNGERPPLHYAETDAVKFARVLRELGGVEPDDLFLLAGKSAAALSDAFARVGQRIAAVRKDPTTRVVVVFYFSGHSDGEALELRRDRVTFSELRQHMASVGADVRVALIDSCRSGALLTAKGGKPGQEFQIRITDDLASTGEVLLTSSAADEIALESREIAGSFFTHHFISGLRGAADASGDGLVTLNEAYQYAYAHTIAATGETVFGTQHPAYDYRLSGQGDLVLAELSKRTAQLVLPGGFDRIVVVDAARDQVVAEVTSDTHATIAVLAGRYSIRASRGGALYAGTIAVTSDGRCEVRSDQLSPVPSVPTTSKGGAPVNDVTAVMVSGGLSTAVADRIGVVPGGRVALVTRRGLSLAISAGSRAGGGFRETSALALAGWRAQWTTGEWSGWAGVESGAGTVVQTVKPTMYTGALAAGALVGLARDVTPGIAVAIEATLDAELLKRNGKLAVIAPPTAWLGLVMRR